MTSICFISRAMATAKKSAKPKKQAKPFFKERKEFVKRLLDGKKSSNIALDIMTASKIFEKFDNDVDFLSKVKMPFKMDGSIKWLLTKDGIEYLDQKYKEFKFKPKEAAKTVDLGEKVGEDILTTTKISLRRFLNE